MASLKIVDVCIVSGRSVAQARDIHYHNPPSYVVIEPEDTSSRTQNLRQTNTNGLKFQGTVEEFEEATTLVASWGESGRIYQASTEYQILLRELTSRYKYRLDTNFAKIDRIAHRDIEEFKSRVHKISIHGMTIRNWQRLLSSLDDIRIQKVLQGQLDIKEENADELVQ